MSFAGKVWKVLVGIKDGMVLIFMLLFFIALFSILTMRPNPGQVRDGALLIQLDGYVVEEASVIDPIETLLSGEVPVGEYQARDIVRALDAAAGDERVKAVVFDLSGFIGGGQVHMQAIGEAIDRVRKADKDVLTYAMAYGDDHMHLAAHASEVWADPLGGAVIAGPGGNNLYYAGLLERLNINARIYKVGEYKSAVEPYSRNSMSDEARENARDLYGALWEEWQANVKKARPKIKLDEVTKTPVEWIEGAEGNLAQAALDGGLVDKLGSPVEFGERVAEIVGEDDWSNSPGAYAKSDFDAYLANNPASSSGKAIGVVTVAGVIVDGDAGPGTAGGTRIADALDAALEDDLAALVVRVDSPGGSVTASEEIRRAIERYRAKDIPVAVSFANVAASGGYWVATAGDRIFAQPETVTGSIGVFAVLPTFENTAAEYGVNSDGYSTTALSGQPDFIGGLTPEVDSILQSSVGNTYSDFLSRVSKARKMSTEKVDAIGQGRVWDGGTARQNGLVDQFGGLDEALEWAAKEAGLEEGDWHASFIGAETDEYDSLIRQLVVGSAPEQATQRGDLFAMAAQQRAMTLARISGDLELLTGTKGIQAYCLECPRDVRAIGSSEAMTLISRLRSFVAP
ncbi:MAG: signal peptide peptidase SppA [Pseudomonadota bacterium]